MAGLDRTTLWTIVPVRGLAAGKSRLAPVLDVRERAALNRELLLRTLAVVSEWSGAPRRTIVMSPCLRALALARKIGATAVREGARAVGLNRAARLGVARAAVHGATHVLILPGDLPYVSAAALNALVKAAGRGARVVLAPDKTGTGTNALLMGVDIGFEHAFGPASFAAHRAAAKRAGFTLSIVRRADLEFDLDTPEDLASWLCEGKAPPAKTACARRASSYPSRMRRVNMRAGMTPIEEER